MPKKYLTEFPNRHYMLWDPYCPRGTLTHELESLRGVELIINEGYTEHIDQLTTKAKSTDNAVFRTLQSLNT